MPRKRPIGEDPRTRSAREEMIQSPSGVDLDARDFSVRAVGLPLFRRTEDGNLSQVLRLVVLAEATAGDVTFTVSDGDTLLDSARARIDEGHTILDLFVPEVYEPRTFSLRVEAGEGEPFEAGVEVRPQRKWSVFLVHHSHLDIGYTDTQNSVLQHHLQYLDSVLDFVSATDDWPEDAKFRWNIEATWPLLHWIESRPESDRSRFFDHVREGRIEICALPFSMHTEAYSIDELARQLRFADELRERYDVPIRTAMQTDVPGATIGLLTPWSMRTYATCPWPTTTRAVLPLTWSAVRSLRVPSTGAPPTASGSWSGIRTPRTEARTWRVTWSAWPRITRPQSRRCLDTFRPSRSIPTLIREAGRASSGGQAWTLPPR